MSYVGKNFGPDASKAQSYCRYYVGVVDKKKGKMRVYDSEIMQMVPKLPDYQEEDEKEKINIPGNIDKTYKQKIDDLTASFGSKKKKQAMGSRLRNEIRGEALEKALSSAVVDAVSQNRNLSVASGGGMHSSLIPPHNKDAERPADVYSLDSIINPHEMEVIAIPAEKIYESKTDNIKEWQEKEEFPLYVMNHIAILPKLPENRWKKSKILMYLSYLIEMCKKPAKSFRAKDPLPSDWPEMIKTKLYKNYTLSVDSGPRPTRCVPQRLKDKLILNILVLCLILDEFELPLNDLQKDLKIGGKSLDAHVKALGCKVKVQRETTPDGEKLEIKIATLEVPLTFPEVSVKRKKDRR